MTSLPRPDSRRVPDGNRMRRAMGAFATGVTVVTAGGDTPHAMTANAFTSVSLDPPLVLVCIGRNAVMHRILSAADTFGISVLAAHQELVARHFANRMRPLGMAQFDNVDWQPGAVTGVPLIGGALVHVECAVRHTYDGGDHAIVVGGLLSLEQTGEGDPLLFFRGQFRDIYPQRSEMTA
jgi:flavin reductase